MLNKTLFFCVENENVTHMYIRLRDLSCVSVAGEEGGVQGADGKREQTSFQKSFLQLLRQ